MIETISSRKQSSIWCHFTPVTSSKAKCDICCNELSYSGGSTTNLHRHLKTKHPTVWPTPATTVEAGPSSEVPGNPASSTLAESARGEDQPVRPTSSGRTLQTSLTCYAMQPTAPGKQKKLDKALAKMIVMHYQPFSIVEDNGFRAFVNLLNQSYELPNG
ncbi:UNVERIFIED_CONTAM: hypothetical protein FKN15_033575 [Acipenser sinensis]